MLRSLLLASSICVGMVLARFAYVGTLRFRFSGLLLNLLLAWIPVLLAVAVRQIAGRGNRPLLAITGVAWLIFFPNAFYLTTDLIHTNRFGLDGVYWWYDHLMTVSFAAAGMFLGSVSLRLLQAVVRRHRGWPAGWLFVGATLVLGSFGVYLGRYLRFNSWDVLLEPAGLAHGIVRLTASPRLQEVIAFCATFSAYSLAIYGFVLSVIHLPRELEERPDRN